MIRRRKRRIQRVLKLLLMTAMPLCTATVIFNASDIKGFIDKADTMTLGKTGSQETYTGAQYYGTEVIEKKDDAESYADAEEYVISKGYGISEELSSAVVDTVSPLDAVSANPGPKPYPTEEQWRQGGEIIRTTYGKFSGTTYFNLEKCGQVNNKTTVPNEKLIEESGYLPDFRIEDTAEPQVLIYHTHTTESYEPYVREYYDPTFNYRTTDETKNMVMVGNEIQAQLEAQGIGVIHATDIHDYPSYNGSYGRSRETIQAILNENPTIKVVLDIHRDAIANETGGYQPYVEIDGKEASQVMIISGCDDGTMGMPNYLHNFRFASYLQQQLESDYPGLTRPILFDYRKYNQDLTTGSLLIEVGSHCNTLEQAQYSGSLIGASLARALNSLK